MENEKMELATTNAGAIATASLVSDDGGFNLEADLTTAKQAFCSLSAETPEQKKQLFNTMNNPDKRLADMIGETIKAKDIYVEVVQCTNKETGELTNQPRIVVIDEKGVSYQCVSIGIYSAIKKLINVYGVPTWETPLPIKVKQISKDTKKILTLAIV
jgi:hypothetical protein